MFLRPAPLIVVMPVLIAVFFPFVLPLIPVAFFHCRTGCASRDRRQCGSPRYPVDGAGTYAAQRLPTPVVAAAPIPPIPGGSPTVVVEEEVHAYTRCKVDVRLWMTTISGARIPC